MKNIKNAFSLIEVLILFTVMSVILAASLPTISRKSNGIPLKQQQGAYYCIANNDGVWSYDENLYKYVNNGTYREMQFIKGNLNYENRNAASCTFNPPARASVFKITLIGAGAGGYDYVKVVNDKNNQVKNYYKLASKYTTKNDTKSFRELGPQELWDAFKGQTIKLCKAIPHGGDGGSAKVSYKVPGKGVCYCSNSPCNNSIKPITQEECNKIFGHTDFRTTWESEILSGGQGGGKGRYINGEYTIPQNPPKGDNKYEENLYLIGALSQYGECTGESCTPEKAKPTVSGYSVTPSKKISGKMQNGKDSDYSSKNPYPCREAPSAAPAGQNASGYTYIMLPNQSLTGANVYMSGTPAKGGKGAGIDASSDQLKDLKGTYDHKDYISSNKITSFKPQLEFNTNFTRRHYYLGDYGSDGEYAHFLKYSLDGPCQITVGQGGPAFSGEIELYPRRVDLGTRIACNGFEKSVQGGAPSVAIQDDQYDQYVYQKKENGDPVDTLSVKSVYPNKLVPEGYRTPRQKLESELFFRLYQPALFSSIGEGGRGAGFVDKCTGKGKDKTDLNRYEGDFTISIGNEYDNSVVETWKTEKLESNCIDKSVYNQYGTVDGKYEHIDALPGQGGAVIITW